MVLVFLERMFFIKKTFDVTFKELPTSNILLGLGQPTDHY
jgi:hypothetical protein